MTVPNELSAPRPNTGRKLFFGLFVFPLLIAVGMAVLLCSVVLMTHEEESPDSLIAAIKTGPPGKRWQRAFELSNELNKNKRELRNEGVMREIIHILGDSSRYDPKTRGFMAMALAQFRHPQAVQALVMALRDGSDDVRIYSLWALGMLEAKEALDDVLRLLKADSPDLRKTAAYVLGVIGDDRNLPALRGLLQDPTTDVRWNTALALARLGDDSGFDTLIQMLNRDELSSLRGMDDETVEKVMINATRGLALIRRPESARILESISKKDRSLKVRQAAMDAIRYQNDATFGRISR